MGSIINMIDCCALPLPVRDYIARYGSAGSHCLDVGRCEQILVNGTQLCVHDHLGVVVVTEAGGWLQRWAHYGDRGILGRQCRGEGRTEMQFVRRTEEVKYQWIMDEFITCALRDQTLPPSEITSCLFK